MLSLRDAVRQMWRDVRSQKLRTALTVFGIIWGTVSVTLLLAFGKGMQRQMIVNAAGIGDGICIAWPGLTSIPFEGLGKGRKIRVNEDDVEAIRRQAPGLRAISSEYAQTMKLNYAAKTVAVDVSGIAPEFGAMRNINPRSDGRFVNPTDMREQRRVLFIGNKLAEQVFGQTNAVGKTVLLGGSPFLIVGVMEKKVQQSSYSGRDNQKGFIPGSTFRALTGEKWVENVIYQPAVLKESKAVSDGVRGVLAGRQRFAAKRRPGAGLQDKPYKIFHGIETHRSESCQTLRPARGGTRRELRAGQGEIFRAPRAQWRGKDLDPRMRDRPAPGPTVVRSPSAGSTR